MTTNAMRGALILLGATFLPSGCSIRDGYLREEAGAAGMAGQAGRSTDSQSAGNRDEATGGSSGSSSSTAGTAGAPRESGGGAGGRGGTAGGSGSTDGGDGTDDGVAGVAGDGGATAGAGAAGAGGDPSEEAGAADSNGGTGSVAAGAAGSAGDPGPASGGRASAGGTAGDPDAGNSGRGGAPGAAGGGAPGAAGGGVGAGGNGGETGEELLGGHAGTSSEPDLVRPFVVYVSPPHDATGVLREVPIVVEFSEPMDQDSVEDALSVAGGSSGDLSLSWNTDSTTLTVSPTTGWVYANGTGPDVSPAQVYTVVLTNAASDLAGNELATDWSSSFSTLREITDTLRPATMLRYDSYGRTAHDCPTTETFDVGFYFTQTATVHKRGLFGFDGSLLPSEVSEIESVVLTVRQRGSTADYYSTGTVEVEARGRESLEVGAAVSTLVTAELGTILDDFGDGYGSLDITESVLSYWPDEQFYQVSDNDSSPNGADAVLSCAIELSFQYLVP